MKITKQIGEYLLGQRWCNFKEDIRLGKIKEFNLESIPFDNGKKLMAIGEVKQEDSTVRYFMIPLQKVSSLHKAALKIGANSYEDALQSEDYWQKLMAFFRQNKGTVHFKNGWKMYHQIKYFPEIIEENLNAPSHPLGVEQSNTTLMVGDKKIAFKQERVLDFSYKMNPEFTMNDKLMRENCSVMPKTYGGFFIKNNEGQIASAGIEQEFIANKGDLWNYALSYLKDRLKIGYLAQRSLNAEDNPEFMDLMHNLSKKTAEMTECLSRPDKDSDFTPQTVDDCFIYMYDKQLKVLLYQTKNNIKNNLSRLKEPTYSNAERLLNNWDTLTQSFVSSKLEVISNSPNKGYISRVHGDFHLGQVMVTEDNDLRFIDFAGEPALPIEQRDQKHIFVRDVAGMYRSIGGYLRAVAVEEFCAEAEDEQTASARRKYAEKAISPLINEATQTFLGKYRISDPWMSLEVLRKNLYEVNYEVNNRPNMAYVAIDGLAELLNPKTDVSVYGNQRQK